MVPIKLRGNSLGERHKQLNTLVNQALGNTEIRHLYKDAEEVSDADRLFKIELAIKCRDIDYILATLKSDDMLYVSRALKATWLITDDEYSHIINPEHLHTVLFPQMHNKAVCKLKFKIRQHLRSEERCELFYKYYSHNLDDSKGSLQFLPYCSKDFILSTINGFENIFNDNGISEEKDSIFKRITERFFDIAEIILEKVSLRSAQQFISVLNYVAISQTDQYLYLLEKYAGKYSNSPQLTKPLSMKIAKKYPQKLFNHLDVYLDRIDLSGVAQVWQKNSIEQFLDVVSKSKAPEVQRWFTEWKVSKLLSRVSEEEKQAVIKKYFYIEEPIKENRDQYIYESNYGNTKISAQKLHKWYERLSFDTAFTEIKQLIRATKSPDDRSTLLIEMSVLAGDDSGHLKQVLHYYFTTHMNEQKMYKANFLNQLVKNKKVYLFNDEIWKFVNDLFISMEAYGNENYGNYNEVIVYHDILNNLEVPEAIMEKYEDNYHSKESIERLNDEQKAQVYNYLIAYFERKCGTQKAKENIKTYYNLISNFVTIVELWEKCVLDYPTIIHATTEIIMRKPSEAPCSMKFYVYIVCFNLLNGLSVPYVIMEKYLQYGYYNTIANLSDENKVKTFELLVTDFENRTSYALNGNVDKFVVSLTNSFIRFLCSSQKLLVDFPYLIALIKVIILAVPNSLHYPSQSTARRQLFDVSLLMSQCEDVLVDIIKHDSSVLNRYFNDFEKLMIEKKIIYRKLLTKLRAYFDDDCVTLFKNSFNTQLKSCEKPSTETKYVEYVNANLSLIFKKEAYCKVIQEYLPKNHKVEWGEEDLSIINIRKSIAKNLRNVRPRIDINIIYEFAQGDYLQYALPSLLSVCMDAPPRTFAEKILPKLLNSPVSVQKHGIRIAFTKLPIEQVVPILRKLWSKTKNVSIRNTIFESTITLLTEQVKQESIQVLWDLIKSFVTNLQEDEERTLLLYFDKHFNSLPAQVRCESSQILYREMERIKDKIDWDELRNSLLHKMQQMLSEGMDLKFVSTVLLENFNQHFNTDYFHKENNSDKFRSLLVEYILFGDEEQQSNGYKTVARPIFNAIIENWNKSFEVGSVQTFFKDILDSLTYSRRWKLEDCKQKTLVFNQIFDQFKSLCNIEEYFAYHMNMKLLIMLNEALTEIDFRVEDKEEVIKKWAFVFNQNCEKELNEMVISYFPSIALSFRQVLIRFIDNISHHWSHHQNVMFSLSLVDNLVREDGLPQNYLLGLYMYDQIRVNLESFEEESGGYHSQVTSRMMSIKNGEIQFHLTTKLL